MRATRTCIHPLHTPDALDFSHFPPGCIQAAAKLNLCAQIVFFLAHAHERIAADNENRNLVGDVAEDGSNLFGYPRLKLLGRNIL